MRILFIAPYPPAHDGIGHYSQMLSDELQRQGHAVGILWSRSSGEPRSEIVGSMPSPHESIAPALAAIEAFKPDIVHAQFAFST